MTETLLEQARRMVCDFDGGSPTVADRDRILAWRRLGPEHEAAWREACREWRDVKSMAQVLPSGDALPARARMFASRRRMLGSALTMAGVAGVAAVVWPPLGLWPSFSDLRADFRTGVGEQKDFNPEPGVVLSLNTRTSLSREAGGEVLALRLLEGETVLSSHDAMPCQVQAGAGMIRTTGGEVEVRNLGGGMPVRVRCHRGLADVAYPGGTVPLLAGQQLFYDNRGLQRSPEMVQRQSDWRDGRLVFRDMRLDDVVDEINRYRPGHVFLRSDALARQSLSANFSIHALDEALEHIQHIYGASLRRMAGGIVVLS